MSSVKPRKFHSRKAHKKSHLGCKTCKRRRIKCDERLPSCSQCSRIDSPCPYLDMSQQELTYFREAKVKSDATSFINMRNMNPTTQMPMGYPYYPMPGQVPHQAHAPHPPHPQHPQHPGHMPLMHPPPPQMPLQGYQYYPGVPGVPQAMPQVQMAMPVTHMGQMPQGQMPMQTQMQQPQMQLQPPPPPPPPQQQQHTALGQHMGHGAPPPPPPTTATIPPIMPLHHASATTSPLPPPPGAMASSSALPPISTLTANTNDSFQLPPILQTANPKHQTLPQKFGTTNTASIVKQGFETDMMRHAYGAWISDSIKNADDHPVLYHSLLAFSHGFLYLKSGAASSHQDEAARTSSRDMADRHRSKSLALIRDYTDNLSKTGDHSRPETKPNASDALLVTTLIMAWDIFLQEDDLKPYIELSKGLAAVLQSLSVNTSQSPTTFCMAESLFQSIKSIHVPPYDSAFWPEFCQRFGVIEHQVGPETGLKQDFYAVQKYFAKVQALLSSTPRNYSTATTYSPQQLYQLLREWLTIFPSRALSQFSTWEEHERLLFAFCHAGSRALDALFPEVRFLFQIGFIGPVDLVGLDNSLEHVSSGGGSHLTSESHVADSHATTQLSYPLRVVGFFKMRSSLASRILYDDDPFEGSPSLVDRKATRFGMLKEVFVSSFDAPSVPQFDHYRRNDDDSPDGSVNGSSVAGSLSPRTSVTSGTSIGDDITSAAAIPQQAMAGSGSWKQDAFVRYFMDRMEILGN